MTSIDVAVLEFSEGGRAIWVHDSQGSTVLRIQCTGKVKIHKSCENICAHSDINVIGDIEICIPDEPEPSMAKLTPITTQLASTEDMDNDRLYQKWNEKENQQ